MSTFATLWQILAAVYRLVIVSWNASVVFVNVMRSAIQEAKQEAGEVMALLDDNTSTLVSPSRQAGHVSLMHRSGTQDVVRSASLDHDMSHTENPWQMLIIARASSFVLLVRLSEQRVLHLEVDEVG